MQQLTNQTAFITGATKGMGRAIANKLAALGCNLSLTARNSADLETLKTILESQYTGVTVQYKVCDLADPHQLDELIDWLNAHTPAPDILVNNVGIFKPASILDETEADFAKQMQVNYYVPHRISRAVGRTMRKNRQGHIFNISSIASREPVATAGTYTVTKFAIRGLTQVLRDELRSYGVKVTEIIPGSTLTASWEGTDIPADRFILPEDVADAIAACLLMSEGAHVEEIRIKPQLGNI